MSNVKICSKCGISEEKSLEKYGRQLVCRNSLLVQQNIELVESKEEKEKALVCIKCYQKEYNPKKVSERKIRKIAADLLVALGADLADPNFIETPRRLASVLIERFGCNIDLDRELESFSNAVFPCESRELVVVNDIRVFSVCPHHILTVEYNIAVGYIPNGRAIGLSKIARIAKILANMPKLQEDVTQEIADIIKRYVFTEDVMVIVSGRHLCMASRGIGQINSRTVTSAVRGAFAEEKAGINPRAEMLELIKIAKEKW